MTLKKYCKGVIKAILPCLHGKKLTAISIPTNINGGDGKAAFHDYLGRFREIISDPLNLMIERSTGAGTLADNRVTLHNGLTVAFSGPDAYYAGFSSILALNRGVHEPLEEYVFQQLLSIIEEDATMLELGAYWGHYSMWLKSCKKNSNVCMVEPEQANLEAGRRNFQINQLEGEFIEDFVGDGHFEVDRHLMERGIKRLSILHSDIQGHEVEMLNGAREALSNQLIDYVFISTHSDQLHMKCIQLLSLHKYRVEVSSSYSEHSTSCDGLIFASSPAARELFTNFRPLGRESIDGADVSTLLDYLNSTRNQQPGL